MPPTANDFRTRLREWLRIATEKGLSHVDVTSGELHQSVGGYPGSNHRMPLCCEVMRDEKEKDDQVMQAPSSGQGATLVIRYMLPRLSNPSNPETPP